MINILYIIYNRFFFVFFITLKILINYINNSLYDDKKTILYFSKPKKLIFFIKYRSHFGSSSHSVSYYLSHLHF